MAHMRPPASLSRVLVVVLSLVALAAGCGDDDTKESFEQDVVAARDVANSAFGHIQRPASDEDLVVRLRAARDDIATASGEIAVAEAPEELTDERRRLASALSDLSQEMGAAANTIEELTEAPGSVQRLVFDHWETVQAALEALRKEGIDVEPLQSRAGTDSQ